MKAFVTILLIVLAATTISAQDTYYTIFTFDHFIPQVSINDRAANLQRATYPQLYDERSSADDLKWVQENDSSLVAFWAQQGDTVLHILTELSGIEWSENDFDIYLVRYFPTIGSSNPTIVPLGGVSHGSLLKAVPRDNRLIFDLILQLSGRMLDQAMIPAREVYYPAAGHPLMEPTPYRRDNLALTLALATAQNVLGYDSAMVALESSFIKQNMIGYDVFEQYFLNKWIISPDRPLISLIMAEPYGSSLVRGTRTPRFKKSDEYAGPRMFVEDLPIKGQLGFAVELNSSNQLYVSKIDPYRVGYLSGLAEGDVIRRVNGHIVRNQKAMIEAILETYYTGGATVQIMRDGRLETVILKASDYLPDEGPGFDEYFNDADSSNIDTIPPDTPDIN